ncbi:MAG: T9SS type A sorting domain-containing protein, partial [Proteobacteria bacterium]
SWTAAPAGFTVTTQIGTAVAPVSSTVAWTKATESATPAGGTDVTKIYSKTVDGGVTWTSGAITGVGVNTGTSIGGITAVSDQKAWVSAFQGSNNNLGGVYATTNGGASWTRQNSATFSAAGAFPNTIYFWNENNGVVMGDPTDPAGTGFYFEIYTTANGGANWTRVPAANIPAPINDDEYGYTNNIAVAGNTVWFGTSQGRLYRSTDMGANWLAFPTPISDFAATVTGNYSFRDNNVGLFLRNDGTLYNTTNGGETWAVTPFVGPVFFNDIDYIPGTDTVITSGGTGSSVSFDNGATWTAIDAFQHVETAFSPTGDGYSTGRTTGASAVMFKYNAALGLSDVDAKRVALVPNPTNGPVELSGVALNQVDVYDLLGKKVFSQSYNAIENVNLDLSQLRTGAYILQATTESGAKETLRLLKK